MKVKEIFEDRYHDEWVKKLAASNRAAAKQRKDAEKQQHKAAQAPKVKKPDIDLFDVYQALEMAVSNVVPDGDPIDTLGPKLRRMGVGEFKIVDTLTAAVKKHYDKKSDYHKYLADMWDLYNAGVEPSERRANPWR